MLSPRLTTKQVEPFEERLDTVTDSSDSTFVLDALDMGYQPPVPVVTESSNLPLVDVEHDYEAKFWQHIEDSLQLPKKLPMKRRRRQLA